MDQELDPADIHRAAPQAARTAGAAKEEREVMMSSEKKPQPPPPEQRRPQRTNDGIYRPPTPLRGQIEPMYRVPIPPAPPPKKGK